MHDVTAYQRWTENAYSHVGRTRATSELNICAQRTDEMNRLEDDQVYVSHTLACVVM